MEKMKKKKQDKYIHLLGKTYPVVIAIDPATTSGYAVWKEGGLKEFGIIRDMQEINPFAKYEKGLLIIESQYLGVFKPGKNKTSRKPVYNPVTLMSLSEKKGMFKIRAEDQGFTVAEQHAKTWQSAIGIPVTTKREGVKPIAMRYAETLIGESIGKGLQDAADAICIGQTFIDKYRIGT